MIKNCFYLSLIIFLFFFSCKESEKAVRTQNQLNNKKGINRFTNATSQIISINNLTINKHIASGEELSFEIQKLKTKPTLDSILIYLNGRKYKSISEVTTNFSINTSSISLGKKLFKISAFYDDITRQDIYFEYHIVSDIIPKNYTFRLIKEYTHDVNAYTQGLVYDTGFLYEGTGQWGTSSLRKVGLDGYDIIQSVSLDNNTFGEGICIYKNMIYQLTWKSKVGYVYQKDNFKKIKEFNYFTEGWGLTTDGTFLIMSDGSNIIYFIEPEYFSEVKRIEVYDNKGKVDKINELEYVNDKIFANIYGKNNIIIIDPESGKVEGNINCESLWPEGVVRNYDHAFNGIAHIPETGHIIVTGKLWPVLYELEIIQ